MIMSILIESPTAEAIWRAAQQLPREEMARLKQMFEGATSDTLGDSWSEADINDLDRATALLIDERFGPEPGNYN